MAFRVRQIVVSASGRRIARDRVVEAASLRIGRASDKAEVADLAVEPHHALAELLPGGRLAIRALGTLGFAADGKAVREFSFDPATPTDLRFGSTTLGISREAGEVLIVVQANDLDGDATADLVADKARFSLGRVMLSSRVLGWSLLAVILGLFLALPVVTHLTAAGTPPRPDAMRQPSHVIGDASWNPGPLSLAHHGLTKHCEACHVKPFQSVRNETCIACHKDTHDHAAPDRLALARGPGGTGAQLLLAVGHAFGREPQGACTDCHVEHQGTGAMEPPRQKFCADCHAGLGARIANTPLGNAADFGTQHPEFRIAVTTNADTGAHAMVSLSDHPRQDTGLTFSHRIHLDRSGGVAKMAMTLGQYGQPLECPACHRRASDGVSFEPVRMERDCESCHSLVYDRVGTTMLRLRHGDIAQMQADLARAGPNPPIVTGRARPGSFVPGGLYAARFNSGGSLAERAFAKDGICGECHTAQWRNNRLSVRHVVETRRAMPNGWFDLQPIARLLARIAMLRGAATKPLM